jgi:hypothetical protein
MKKFLAIMLSIVIALTLFGCSAKEEPTTTKATTTETTTEAKPIINPFTGEDGYNEEAVGVRPVAIVVENLKAARPQWGIETPDIIVEGEVEGGISRMLWLYADMNAVPEKVGPLRSARPSYVEFSELFDSIFIHWGGSHSKGDYVGGYGVIKADDVDDIDGMNGGSLFSRDKSRNVSSEHTGVLKGSEISSAIEKKGYRTKLDEKKASTLTFNSKTENAGETVANSISFTFSSRTDTRKFTYSTTDNMYHTSDWETDVEFENVVLLMTDSKYITTPYKGSTTTYLNYTIKNTSGSGYYASNGTSTKIKWSTENGTLVLTDENGQALNLNKGRSYIGLGSTNHDGKVAFA